MPEQRIHIPDATFIKWITLDGIWMKPFGKGTLDFLFEAVIKWKGE